MPHTETITPGRQAAPGETSSERVTIDLPTEAKFQIGEKSIDVPDPIRFLAVVEELMTSFGDGTITSAQAVKVYAEAYSSSGCSCVGGDLTFTELSLLAHGVREWEERVGKSLGLTAT